MDKVNPSSLNSQGDKELISRILLGETGLFGILIDQTKGLVYQIVYHHIRLTEDRKDITQNIYLKAFRGLRSFRFESKLSTWIAQIAYNTCKNHLEKKKIVFTDIPDVSENISVKEPDPEQFLVQKNQTAILKQAVENLPPVYSTVIILFHQEELSYEEIARITNLPIGTIKSYLFRARKLLKEKLSCQYEKESLW